MGTPRPGGTGRRSDAARAKPCRTLDECHEELASEAEKACVGSSVFREIVTRFLDDRHDGESDDEGSEVLLNAQLATRREDAANEREAREILKQLQAAQTRVEEFARRTASPSDSAPFADFNASPAFMVRRLSERLKPVLRGGALQCGPSDAAHERRRLVERFPGLTSKQLALLSFAFGIPSEAEIDIARGRTAKQLLTAEGNRLNRKVRSSAK